MSEYSTAYIEEVFSETGLPLTDRQAWAFLKYYEILTERNQVMNLTAISGFEESVIRHFADSCMLFVPMLENARKQAGILEGSRLIDVGTGAGFPGLPLKILRPELRVVLLDALQKRVDFLNDVITTLDLNHIDAIHARAEEGAREETLRESFDLAVSRAVAHLSVLSEYCLPFVSVGGCFAAYKSGNIDQELSEAGNALNILGGEVVSMEHFSLPRFGDERSIIFIRKVRETPEKYPRKAGKPGKNPL